MNARIAAVAAALSLTAGLSGVAIAQQAPPSPAPTPVVLPSAGSNLDPLARAAIDALTGIVRQQIFNLSNSTSGNVSYFKHFDMQVQTGPNAYRTIRLHQGTVINPRGESLAIGEHVQVGGQAQSDGSIDANTITIDH